LPAVKPFWLKFLHFYIYSSIHISIGSVCLLYVTATTFNIIIPIEYCLFVFSSTLFIYCLHRIVGIEKVFEFEQKGRFAIIHQYKKHLIFYTICGGLCSVILFFLLDKELKLWFIIPGLISLLYTLPVLTGSKRLRDFDYIKIFLIALVWSFATAYLPSLSADIAFGESVLILLERAAFILAITIPFDIRDNKIDKMIEVKTIVSIVGPDKSVFLSILLLTICSCFHVYFFTQDVFELKLLCAQLSSYFVTAVLIFKYSKEENDMFFSGILDGTMILLAILVWVSQQT